MAKAKKPRKAKPIAADNWWVTITEDATGDVVKEMGPMSESRAERVADGASINLDHERFSVSTEERL